MKIDGGIPYIGSGPLIKNALIPFLGWVRSTKGQKDPS